MATFLRMDSSGYRTAFLAQVNVNAVLPIDGRAAIIIRSPSCHPEVYLSTSRPAGTPVIPDGLPRRSSRYCSVSFKISPIAWELALDLVLAISKILCSAASRDSKASDDESYAFLIISLH